MLGKDGVAVAAEDSMRNGVDRYLLGIVRIDDPWSGEKSRDSILDWLRGVCWSRIWSVKLEIKKVKVEREKFVTVLETKKRRCCIFVRNGNRNKDKSGGRSNVWYPA